MNFFHYALFFFQMYAEEDPCQWFMRVSFVLIYSFAWQVKQRLRQSLVLLTEVCPYILDPVSSTSLKRMSEWNGDEEEEGPGQDILSRATAAFCQTISLSLREFDGHVHSFKRQVSCVLVHMYNSAECVKRMATHKLSLSLSFSLLLYSLYVNTLRVSSR